MKILEFGNKNNKKIILIHGFLSPYQIWNDYIDYYQKDFHIIVPILPGHNPNKKEFVSLEKCCQELEEYYISNYGNDVYAIYGMSMGGIIASLLLQNKRLKIEKIVLESSPLLSFNKVITYFLTKGYLNIIHKAQKRNSRVLKQAINTMVPEDKMDVFLELLDNISDKEVICYLKEVSRFKLPNNINVKDTEITYCYGSKISELIFKNVANYLKKYYNNSKIICFKGKGHCEDALVKPKIRINFLNNILFDKVNL